MTRRNRNNGNNHGTAGLTAVDLGETAPGSGVREYALLDGAGREMGAELLDERPVLLPLLDENIGEIGRSSGVERPASGVTARLMRDVGGLPAVAPTLALFFGGTGREEAQALIAHLRTVHGDTAYELVRCFLKVAVVDSSDESSEFMGESISENEFVHAFANLDQVLEEVRNSSDHPLCAHVDREDLLRIPPGETAGSGSGRCRLRGAVDLHTNLSLFDDKVDSLLQEISRAVQEARTELGGSLPRSYRTLDLILSASTSGGAGSAMIPLATERAAFLCRRRGLKPRIQVNLLLPSVFEDFDIYENGLGLTYPTLTELDRL